MLIHLCNTPDERNVINKDIRQVGDVNAIIKGDLSVEKPIFIFDFDGNADVINYMIISELGRNYFIDEVIHLTGHRYEIHASVDVLESFKGSILSLSCVIEKQEQDSLCNKYYNDGSYVSQEKEFIYSKNFPNGFNENGEFILITAGGIASQ